MKIPYDIVKEIQKRQSDTFSLNLINEYSTITYSKVTELNKAIKQKIKEWKRIEIKWEILLLDAFFFEDLIESEHSIDWRIRSPFSVERRGKFGRFMDSLGRLRILAKLRMDLVC